VALQLILFTMANRKVQRDKHTSTRGIMVCWMPAPGSRHHGNDGPGPGDRRGQSKHLPPPTFNQVGRISLRDRQCVGDRSPATNYRAARTMGISWFHRVQIWPEGLSQSCATRAGFFLLPAG